jgi:hypothetical protein
MSSDSKWGAAAEAARRGERAPSRRDRTNWQNDERNDDSEWIRNETRKTQEETRQSSRRALQRIKETESVAQSNLVILNTQSEQFNEIEKKLDKTTAAAKAQESQVSYLKSLNKYFFLPAFGGNKAERKEAELQKKIEAEDFGNKKHIREREKDWNKRNERLQKGDQLHGVIPQRNHFTTPDGVEQDDVENEINDNVNNISAGISRLKMMGIAMNDELESQSRQMSRISQRSENASDKISKLNRSVGKMVERK